MKWRGKTVPRLCFGYFPILYMPMKQFLDKVLGHADIMVETWAKNCREPFCNQRKGLEVTFCQHGFKCNVQEHHFLYFLWRNHQQFSRFYDLFLFSPCHRSNIRHYQVMDLFKSRESFKKNFIQIITEKRNDFRMISFF